MYYDFVAYIYSGVPNNVTCNAYCLLDIFPPRTSLLGPVRLLDFESQENFTILKISFHK